MYKLQFFLHLFISKGTHKIVGWKINLSGISPAKRSGSGPNSVYVDMSGGDNIQGILGAIGPFWAKWGLGRVPRSPSFFVVIQRTFRQLLNGRCSPNLVTKRSSVYRCGIWKDIFENFHFRGHLPPKSEIENHSNRHLTQSRLQVTDVGCGATGRQSWPIFGFWLFSL